MAQDTRASGGAATLRVSALLGIGLVVASAHCGGSPPAAFGAARGDKGPIPTNELPDEPLDRRTGGVAEADPASMTDAGPAGAEGEGDAAPTDSATAMGPACTSLSACCASNSALAGTSQCAAAQQGDESSCKLIHALRCKGDATLTRGPECTRLAQCCATDARVRGSAECADADSGQESLCNLDYSTWKAAGYCAGV